MEIVLKPVEERFREGLPWEAYLKSTVKNHDLWVAIDEHVEIAPEDTARAAEAARRSRLSRVLVLSEDWCGDAVNILPWVARLFERVPGVELKILGRDENPDLMNTHLTGTSRSIPVVIFLDAAGNELGWWGPRPAELQRWFLDVGHAMPKAERYRDVRGWYARDKGRAIIDETLGLLERAALSA